MKGFAIAYLIVVIALMVGGIAAFRTFFNTKPPITPNLNEATVSAQLSPSPSPIQPTYIPTLSPIPIVLTPTPAIVYNSRVRLEGISPSKINSGTEVILTGQGFGTITGQVILYGKIVGPCGAFYCLDSTNRWTDTEVKFTMPPSPGGENLQVEVMHKDGTRSNRLSFTLGGGQPRPQDISPKNAQPLQSINISGFEFGSSKGTINIYEANNTLTVHAKCDVTSWGDGYISCTLPSTVNNNTDYYFEIVASDNRKSNMFFYKVGE